MSGKNATVASFKAWYRGLATMKRYGGRPAKGTVAAALVVLERLREDCDLTMDAHLAPGGAQIAGLNLPALRKILGGNDAVASSASTCDLLSSRLYWPAHDAVKAPLHENPQSYARDYASNDRARMGQRASYTQAPKTPSGKGERQLKVPCRTWRLTERGARAPFRRRSSLEDS